MNTFEERIDLSSSDRTKKKSDPLGRDTTTNERNPSGRLGVECRADIDEGNETVLPSPRLLLVSTTITAAILHISHVHFLLGFPPLCFHHHHYDNGSPGGPIPVAEA